MIYRFKNTNESDLFHIQSGINFPSDVYVECNIFDIIKLFDEQLIGWLNSGDLVFNNGTSDYSFDKAMNKLDWTGINYQHTQALEGESLVLSRGQQSIIEGDLEIDGTYEIGGEMIIKNYT